MSPVTDVDAFYFEHRGCGDLDGGVGQEGTQHPSVDAQ
jgi:hypothetical protein